MLENRKVAIVGLNGERFEKLAGLPIL